MINKIDRNLLLSSGKYKKEKSYWLDKLSGEWTATVLMQDSAGYSTGQAKVEQREYELPDPLSAKLLKLCKNSDLSLYLFLLTALKCLIYRYTASGDIDVASPVYKPNRTADTLNDFVVLRDSITGEMTFRECLLSVRQTTLEAYENQDYPFDKIAEALSISYASGIACLLKNIHDEVGMEDAGCSIVFAFERFEGERIKATIYYSPSAFREQAVAQIFRHLTNILNCAAENIQVKLSELEMLPEEEKRQMLFDFNNTHVAYPADRTIYQLFEEQVERTPEDIAVICGEGQLTYRELNEKANRIARLLRAKGVGRESIVGILTDHSPELLMGILGVLKAGGAYLPIDPAYPEERITYMLEDSGAGVLLIDNGQLTMDNGKSMTVIDLNDETNYTGDGSNLEPANMPQDLAYVIYTSGSTGRPKGVMVTHRGLVNYIWWARKVYLKGEKMNFALYSSISFDLTVTSVFTPLISGNSAIIYNEDGGALSLEKVVRDKKAGIVKLTPTHLKLMEGMDLRESGIRRLIVGGEDLKTETARKITGRFGNGVEIYNEYGPTETVVGCMIYRYDPDRDVRNSVPIGIPADNVQIYLLDRHLNPVPAGAAGEMYISGDGVARGYLNRPELTDEKFISNPFVPGELMYKTGDLARRLPDGNIEFIGRADHQVKIRGYRIELGEIEAAVLGYGPVSEAVVIDREDREGGKYLCAYIVAAGELEIPELRKYLSDRLMDAMVPSYFVKLDRLPLTPNGKIDRKALPEPGGYANTGMEYVAPRDGVEQKLADMWQEILGLERMGINDSFFELGGHSLKATVLASRIHREFNVKLELKEVFKRPTVKGLAEYIRGAEENIYASIQPVEERGFYPASSAQKRMFVLSQLKGVGTTYNIPGALIIEGKLDRVLLKEAFKKLIERHEAFRTSFKLIDEEPVQVIHRQVEFEIDYREDREERLKDIMQEFFRPFDLGKAPLLRAMLVKLIPGADMQTDRHALLFEMHHIISDGVSRAVLISEFARLYKGKGLSQLRLQYKDFAVWQNDLLASGAMKQQEDYWLDRFSGELPVLDMPIDYPRPPVQSFEGDRLEFALDGGLAAGLKEICLRKGATLNMALMAVCNTLLSKYTGQEDIVVGTAVAGRPHADLENIIGVFINTLPMRNFPLRSLTFGEFLESVRVNALKDYENQEYQFEQLVEKLYAKRDMGRNPLYDVMFSLQNLDSPEVDIDGLKFMPYSFENNRIHVDLIIVAYESGNEIIFNLGYCTRLFKRETMEKLPGHFTRIVEQVVKNPEIKLSDIEILSEEEKGQLLARFRSTAAGCSGIERGSEGDSSEDMEVEFDL